MKTATNIYIFNLALADTLGTAVLPLYSLSLLFYKGPIPKITCKLLITIINYNRLTSVFTLTMMSVDRYVAVCHPVSALGFRTPAKTKTINVLIWALSSAIEVPILAVTQVNTTGGNLCTLTYPSEHSHMVMVICDFIITFVVPVLIITICYGLMILRLRRMYRRSGSKEKGRKIRRVTRMVLVVVLAFIISWTPLQFFNLICSMVYIDFENIFIICCSYVCVLLATTNGSMNPLLYAFLDKNFKRYLRDCCPPCRKVRDQHSMSRVRNTTRKVQLRLRPLGGGTEASTIRHGPDPSGSSCRRIRPELQSEVTQISTTEF